MNNANGQKLVQRLHTGIYTTATVMLLMAVCLVL